MPHRDKPYSKYVQDAIKRIKETIDTEPLLYKTANELLEQVSGPHRNSVEKAFRDVYGARIKEYQVRQRLEHSKKLLNEGITKKKVSDLCLYTTQSAYAAAFKKEFNMTPSRWQQLYC